MFDTYSVTHTDIKFWRIFLPYNRANIRKSRTNYIVYVPSTDIDGPVHEEQRVVAIKIVDGVNSDIIVILDTQNV
jgi:hypothetical protein